MYNNYSHEIDINNINNPTNLMNCQTFLRLKFD